jgi:hypothetical protein
VKPIGDLEPEIGQRPLPEEVEELRAAYLATLQRSTRSSCQRAVYVDYASELIEGVIISAGGALARFFGGEWYRETIPPIQRELEAIREALPIDVAARAQ